ncbi:ModD protein [Campylobacter sp. faydin G-105]|uniref:ModD protein n=1 Tax=Campylobacter anatolicus TaxID=2829105 RepID=UPI001B9AF1AD|nr:ModD protein [Campylobacter anatolicus]MBR8462194.1 ModD protein [Campylobacter anatolicus]
MISDAQIWEYIRSDVPFEDLTTSLQTKHLNRLAKLSILTRESVVLSNVDICECITKMLNCSVQSMGTNSKIYNAGDVLFMATGAYANIHKVWKLVQILLEYSCKISTYTHEMVCTVKAVAPHCQVLTTRKSYPFAKEFCVSAVVAGGGGVHRLNLSDSVLFFENHIKAYTNFDEFLAEIPKFKSKMPEKIIGVECDDLINLEKLLRAEVELVQCDKMSVDEISYAITLKDKINPNAKITATGGINLKNAKEYATTGINAIITSAPYLQGLSDLTAKIELE